MAPLTLNVFGSEGSIEFTRFAKNVSSSGWAAPSSGSVPIPPDKSTSKSREANEVSVETGGIDAPPEAAAPAVAAVVVVPLLDPPMLRWFSEDGKSVSLFSEAAAAAAGAPAAGVAVVMAPPLTAGACDPWRSLSEVAGLWCKPPAGCPPSVLDGGFAEAAASARKLRSIAELAGAADAPTEAESRGGGGGIPSISAVLALATKFSCSSIASPRLSVLWRAKGPGAVAV